MSGTAFAQNWLDLDAERGPSTFDQRHLLTAQFQYTTGVGVAGGALVDGWQGSLLKGWTITQSADDRQRYAADAVLPDDDARHRLHRRHSRVADRRLDRRTDGYYLNPAAYTTPAPGEWGNAGRNSATRRPRSSD